MDKRLIDNGPAFLVIVTGYNCEQFVAKCLISISGQTYRNYFVSILNDGSTDKTMSEMFIMMNAEFTLACYYPNLGTFFARDSAIKNGSQFNYDVIVMVDMDDYLLPNALEKIAEQYVNNDVWMTYGNYQYLNGKKNPVPIHYSDEVHKTRDYRQDTFRCTHLRSFRKELYQAIPKWELTTAEVNSYPDAEILFSMMEICGKEKIGVIDEPIYVYNNNNPISTLNRFGKDVAGYKEIISRPKRELKTAL
jgi:glycosyltransferase involved in cell wall biosynthesis